MDDSDSVVDDSLTSGLCCWSWAFASSGGVLATGLVARTGDTAAARATVIAGAGTISAPAWAWALAVVVFGDFDCVLLAWMTTAFGDSAVDFQSNFGVDTRSSASSAFEDASSALTDDSESARTPEWCSSKSTFP
mgnify:CR=1 FL=1